MGHLQLGMTGIIHHQTHIFLLLLIGGAVLVSAGIIGEYLAKVYVQTKGRPIYIAKEILSNKRSDSDG